MVSPFYARTNHWQLLLPAMPIKHAIGTDMTACDPSLSHQPTKTSSVVHTSSRKFYVHYLLRARRATRQLRRSYRKAAPYVTASGGIETLGARLSATHVGLVPPHIERHMASVHLACCSTSSRTRRCFNATNSLKTLHDDPWYTHAIIVSELEACAAAQYSSAGVILRAGSSRNTARRRRRSGIRDRRSRKRCQ